MGEYTNMYVDTDVNIYKGEICADIWNCGKGSRQQVGTLLPAAAADIYHLIHYPLVEKISDIL